jgi:hypothetical protein
MKARNCYSLYKNFSIASSFGYVLTAAVRTLASRNAEEAIELNLALMEQQRERYTKRYQR